MALAGADPALEADRGVKLAFQLQHPIVDLPRAAIRHGGELGEFLARRGHEPADVPAVLGQRIEGNRHFAEGRVGIAVTTHAQRGGVLLVLVDESLAALATSFDGLHLLANHGTEARIGDR